MTAATWEPSVGVGSAGGPRLLRDDPVAKVAAWVWLTGPRRLAAKAPGLGGIVGDGHVVTAVPLLALFLPVACAAAGFWVGAQGWGYTFIATESVFLLSALLALGALSTQLGLVTLVAYALGDFFVRLTAWQYTVLLPGDGGDGGGTAGAPGAADPFGGLVREGDGLLDSGFVAGLWRVRLPLLILYGVYAVGALAAPRMARGVAGMVLRAVDLPRTRQWLVGSAVYVATVGLAAAGWLASAPLLIRPVFAWKGGMAGSIAPGVVTVPLQHFEAEIVAAAVLAAVVRQAVLFVADRSPDLRARVDVVGGLAEPVTAAAAQYEAGGSTNRAVAVRRIVAAAVVGPLLGAGMLTSPATWVLAVGVAAVVALLRSDLLPADLRATWSATAARVPVLARLVGLVVGVRLVAGLLAGSLTSYDSLAGFVLVTTLLGALVMAPEPAEPAGDHPPRLAFGAALVLAGVVGFLGVAGSAAPAQAQIQDCSTFADCFAAAASLADAAAAVATFVPVALAASALGPLALGSARQGAAAAREVLTGEVLGAAPVAAAAPPAVAPGSLARAMATVGSQPVGPVHEPQAGGLHAEELLARGGGVPAATAAALAVGTPASPATADVVVDCVPCPGCAQVLASQLHDQRAWLTPQQRDSVRHRVLAAGPGPDAATTTRSIQVLLEAGWDVAALDMGAGPTDAGAWLTGAVDEVRTRLGLPPPPTAATAAPTPATAVPAPAPAPTAAPAAVPDPVVTAPAPDSAPAVDPGVADIAATADPVGVGGAGVDAVRAMDIATETVTRARAVVEDAARAVPGSPAAADVAARAEDVAWKAVYAASQAHQAVVAGLGAAAPAAAVVQDLAGAAMAAHHAVEAAGPAAPVQAGDAAARGARAAEEAGRAALTALGLPVDQAPTTVAGTATAPAPAPGAATGPMADARQGSPRGASTPAAPAADPLDDLPQQMVGHGEAAIAARRRVEGAVARAALMTSWATLGHNPGTTDVAREVADTATRAADRAVAAAEAAHAGLALTGPAPATPDPTGLSGTLAANEAVTLAARLGDLAVEASREAAAELGLAPADAAGETALVDSPLASTMREAADRAGDHENRRIGPRLAGTDDPDAQAASERWAVTSWDAAQALLRQAADVAAGAAATALRVTAAGPHPSSRAAGLARRADQAARMVAVLADTLPRRHGGPGFARAVAGGASISAVAAAEAVLGADEVVRLADDIAAAEARADTSADRPPLRAFDRNEDAAAYGEQTWAAARRQLTPDQRAALAGLTTKHGHHGRPGFVALYATCRGTTAERGVHPSEADAARESIGLIDDALRLQPVPEDVLVVRETYPDAFDRPVAELTGTVQEDPAFLSTALTAGPVYDRARPVALHLRVPAGTAALYLADASEAPGEQELVLGRGVRYQVVGARRIGRRWHVYGEVLQEGEG